MKEQTINFLKEYKYLIVAVLIVLIAYAVFLFIPKTIEKEVLPEEITNESKENLEEQKQELDSQLKDYLTEEEKLKQKESLEDIYKKIQPPSKEEVKNQLEELDNLKK